MLTVINRGNNLVLSIIIGMGVLGCGDLAGVGGTSKYACKAPAGVICQSMSGTYYNRNDQSTEPDGPKGTGMSRKNDERASEAKFKSRATSGGARRALAPGPLRSRAKVLRMRISPWEDSDRDLVDEMYVYVQVDRGRWLLEHVQEVRRAQQPILQAPTTTSSTAAKGDRTNDGAASPDHPIPMLQRPPSNGGEPAGAGIDVPRGSRPTVDAVPTSKP